MATYSNNSGKNLIDIIGSESSFSPGNFDEPSFLSSPSNGMKQSDAGDFTAADKRAIIQSGMSAPGTVGNKLISGGTTAGLMALGAPAGSALAAAGPVGWGIAGLGGLMSLIEAEQMKKAEEEAAKVAAENQKTENMKAQIGKLMNMRLGVSA